MLKNLLKKTSEMASSTKNAIFNSISRNNKIRDSDQDGFGTNERWCKVYRNLEEKLQEKGQSQNAVSTKNNNNYFFWAYVEFSNLPGATWEDDEDFEQFCYQIQPNHIHHIGSYNNVKNKVTISVVTSSPW